MKWQPKTKAEYRYAQYMAKLYPDKYGEYAPKTTTNLLLHKVDTPKKRKKKYRAGIAKELRQAVLERDRHRCTMCGAADSLHIHHIKHRKDGGQDVVENLTTLCNKCHAREHCDEPVYNLMSVVF